MAILDTHREAIKLALVIQELRLRSDDLEIAVVQPRAIQ